MNGLCRAAGISRAGYYRFRQCGKAKRTDMDLRSQMQRIALRWPAYGYRRVHAELLRQGWTINHKRVLRLLRVDNLLCVRRRKFLLGTTDSRHGLPIYPNLAAGMVLTSLDQLWVADITYIRLQWEFVYLAVVLDAFSRRCLGWALQRSLESALVLEALRMALMRRATAWTRPSFRPRGAICLARLHHTTGTTRHSYQHEPIGNALRQCPRGKFHEDSQIRGSLPHRIPRPRGSQGFDQAVSGKSLQPAALAFGAGLSSAPGVRTQLTILASPGEKTIMSFLRHEEIYRSDVRLGQSWERQPVSSLPVLIGCYEFPVGYSLAGCPPAEPASASPTSDDSQQSTLPYNDFSANGNYPLNFLSQSKGALHPNSSSRPA